MNTPFVDEVIGEMEAGDRIRIDPATLALLGKVITLVVLHLIQKCVLDKQAVNRPGPLRRAKLARLVNRIGREEGLDNEHRQRAVDALLKRGTRMDQGDIDRVISEMAALH